MSQDEIEQSNRSLITDIVNDIADIEKYHTSKGADVVWHWPSIYNC